MNNTTTYSRSMFGLTEINADIINTGSLNVLTTIQAPTVKTNLVQSINPTNNLTLEALTTGQVIIRSNGANIAVFDTANNLITFNARVSQTRTDNAVSFGPGACLAPTGTTQQLSAFGAGALQFIQGGNFNSAFGSNALRNVSSGGNNVGFGADAGRNITSGGGNMCIGLQANFNTTSGGDNCSVGTQAGSGYNTGGSNVCIGTRSGVISTSFNGSNNVSIGFEAGQASATMNGVTSIGRRANYANTVSCSNSTAIGVASANTTSNQIQLGFGGQFTSTDNMSIGKTTAPTTKLDVEGSSLFNGSVRVRNGNNLQIFNNGNTQQTNQYMSNNDFYVNNLSSTGTITYQINYVSIFSVASDQMNSNVIITGVTPPVGDDTTKLATTEFIVTSLINFLNTPNAWSATQSFNVSLPTSTLNPTSNNQFTTKLYVDNKVSTSLSGYALLASSNTFTGFFNTFNSSVAFGTQAPTCSFAPSLNSSLANKEYVDKSAIVPATKLFTFTEDFFTTTGGAPNGGFGYALWATTGTGSATHAVGTNLNHVGVWTLTNNRSIYNTDVIYSGIPKQVKWIVRETTALNTFNWYAGIIQSIGVWGNSAFIGHTSGGTTFFASVNNVNLYNFTSVTWIQNKWYEITLDFDDPDITFTLTNLTDNITESYVAIATSYNFARDNTLAFQHVSVAGTNTAEVDYVSMTYQCDRT